MVQSSALICDGYSKLRRREAIDQLKFLDGATDASMDYVGGQRDMGIMGFMV